MNRKQRRRLRRIGNKRNYYRNRAHWCSIGPPIIMDDPTEQHVKELLMEWMAPRTVLTEIAKVLEEHQATISGKYLYDFMQKIALEGNEPKVQEMIRDTIWRHLVHGAVTDSPVSLKVATV